MKRICDSCHKAEAFVDLVSLKKIPATCHLWQAIYGNSRVPDDLESIFKRTYGLEVEVSIEIKECKGFE